MFNSHSTGNPLKILRRTMVQTEIEAPEMPSCDYIPNPYKVDY